MKQDNKHKKTRKKRRIWKGGNELTTYEKMYLLSKWKKEHKIGNRWDGLTFEEQYNAMVQSIELMKKNDVYNESWYYKTPQEKQEEIDRVKKESETQRKQFEQNKTDESKDFQFMKHKNWLYPLSVYIMELVSKTDPNKGSELGTKTGSGVSIEDAVQEALRILNSIFRPNTYNFVPSAYKEKEKEKKKERKEKEKEKEEEEWKKCVSTKSKLYNCRKSKGFSNRWIPATLKYNPYIADIHDKTIPINGSKYSKYDLAEMSYQLLQYEPQIQQLFRITEGLHLNYLTYKNTSGLNIDTDNESLTKEINAKLQYLDYCRQSSSQINECEFVKTLIKTNEKGDLERIVDAYRVVSQNGGKISLQTGRKLIRKTYKRKSIKRMKG